MTEPDALPESLERRLERISRNLTEAAAELQNLVSVLRVRLGQDQADMQRGFDRLTGQQFDQGQTEGGGHGRHES